MKRAALIGTVTAAILVAGAGVGAAIATTQIPAATPAPSVGASEISGANPTAEATPLVAETPTAPDDADAAFLAYVRAELAPETSIGDASDEALIAAGHTGCEQAAAGVPWEEIRLVEGEQPTWAGYYMDTSAILNGALYNYCPELIPDVEG